MFDSRLLLIAVLLSLIPLILSPTVSSAQHVMGPRSAGMGETHRAVGNGNDAIHLNPAGMSLLPRYVIEGFWLRHPSGNETLASLSVVDSSTGPVAAGLAYTYDYAGTGGSTRSGSRFDASTSYSLSGPLLLGSTIRYLHYSTEDGHIQRFTGDIGVILQLGQSVNVGAVGHNLINHTDKGKVAPLSFGIGAAAVPLRNLVLGFDYRIDPEEEEEPASYSVGAEYFFMGYFALRGGWILDERLEEQRYSLGGSYVEGGYAIDFSWAASLAEEGRYEIGVGMRIFVK